MHQKLKSYAATLIFSIFFGLVSFHNARGQESCKPKKTTTQLTYSNSETTAGCQPSSCKGANTKFGEAKAITHLRSKFLDLRKKMTKSGFQGISPKVYSEGDLVGKSDGETLEILADEIRIIEKALSGKAKGSIRPFKLPDSKARQLAYLLNRLEILKEVL